MIMSEVEETVTTLELDEETFEEIYRVRIEVIFITVILLGNFCENSNFNNFAKKFFANYPCGQHKRYGMAILSQNL